MSMDLLFIILGYTFIGGALKYIDQVYDEHIFNKDVAYVLSVFAGIALGLLITFDTPYSTSFFIAMILGLIVTKKIDTVPFALGTFLGFGIPLFFIFTYSAVVVIDLLAVFLFGFTSFLDEISDHFAETGKLHGFLGRVFRFRPWMWVGAFILFAFNKFLWYHLIGFLGFTVAYLFVEWYSYKLKEGKHIAKRET